MTANLSFKRTGNRGVMPPSASKILDEAFTLCPRCLFESAGAQLAMYFRMRPRVAIGLWHRFPRLLPLGRQRTLQPVTLGRVDADVHDAAKIVRTI